MATPARQKPAQEPTKIVTLPGRGERKLFRRIPRWTLWLGLALAAIVAWQIWRSLAASEIRYESQAIDRGSIDANVTATGTLNPVVNVQVSSQVSGNIKALFADFNTKVTKGQLVALVDPQIFQAQVDQANAAAAAASATAVTARAQVEKAKADLAGAAANRDNLQAVLAKDKANALNAEIQWKRSEGLFEEGVVSQQDHDTAKALYDASAAQVAADQSQINAAEHSIQSAEAAVNVAQTQLNSAQAQERQALAALAQAKINLDHTQIVAPVSGTVIARHFDVGQTVAASFQAPDIFDIAQDLTQMQVDTNVDESDVGVISNGQAASFTVDAYPGLVFHGSVTDVRKAPIVAQNVVTYDVVIQVANPDFKLFPGMTANVSILAAHLDNVLRVSNAALRFHPSAEMLKGSGLPAAKGGTQVYLVSGRTLRAVPVKLGISDGKFTTVVSGDLKPGDAAVTRAVTSASAPSNPTTAPGGGTRRVGF